AWSLLDQSSRPGGLLYKDGVFQTPVLVGLIVAAVAPILAVILSLIRSPGANAHAQHVGQPRVGRAIGTFGFLMVVVGIGVLVWGFYLAMQAMWAAQKAQSLTDVMPTYTIIGYGVPLVVVVFAFSALAALIATIIGAAVVAFAEKNARRPSGFARFSAGAGVVTIGCVGGLYLALAVKWHKLGEVNSAADKPMELDYLTESSLVILAGMLTLLVMGFGWCFYRAIKAAGRTSDQEVQTEGLEA
ncbi:MAG: hypothetical protein KAU28_08630, partial [Phycisphaerae bacterium]|nr:hypothetical protein [Phycisphaerae bacterium]